MREQQPPPLSDADCAGRRYINPTDRRAHRERSRDLCPERPRLLDP